MPDYSPWGSLAMGGIQPQSSPQPVSGVAAGAGAMPQMNQGLNPSLYGGSLRPMSPPMGLPFGGGMQGGPFSGGQMGNPMQFLLPFLMQRMGMMNRPQGPGPAPMAGGPYGPNNMGMPPTNVPGGGGINPTTQGGSLAGMSGAPRPPMPPVPQNFGPAMNAFLPPSMGGQAQPYVASGDVAKGDQMRPGAQAPATPAPPPQAPAGNATGQNFGAPAGLPSGIPMSLQTQVNAMTPQGQVQNTLNSMAQMNPTQMMMAQLLRQQLPFG